MKIIITSTRMSGWKMEFSMATSWSSWILNTSEKTPGMNLCNLASLSKAPSLPQEVKIDVKRLTNFTYLSWKAPKTGKVKGYYVLMRETTSAFWQKKFFTTELEYNLPYSKDNYFFAVQSVNETGNESLAVVPGVPEGSLGMGPSFGREWDIINLYSNQQRST